MLENNVIKRQKSTVHRQDQTSRDGDSCASPCGRCGSLGSLKSFPDRHHHCVGPASCPPPPWTPSGCTIRPAALLLASHCSILCLLPWRATYFATDHRHASPECRAYLIRCQDQLACELVQKRGSCPSPTPLNHDYSAGSGTQASVTKAHAIPTCFPEHLLKGLLLLFIRSVVSDSLRAHGLQHPGLRCPSPTPGAAQTHVY